MSDLPKKYPDGFIRRKPLQTSRLLTPTDHAASLTDEDLATVATRRSNLHYARRIRRVARIMIVATKQDISAQQVLRIRRQKAFISPFVLARNNAPRFAAVLFLCGFTVSSLFLPLLQANNQKLVQLNEASKLLVGATRDDAAKYLKYDDKEGKYTFAAESRDTSDTYEHAGRQEDAYEAVLPKKASTGITVTDTESKIDITLTPQFFTTEAEKTDGNNLIYRSGNRQLVYTLKYNGLKEDIILPSYQGEELQFSFRLSLPAGVEARLDSQGNIGIFSSDPTLFGNISFGTNQDRAKVEMAREKADKNNLVMTIPFPVIKDAKGQEYTHKAKYTLGDKRTEKRSVDLPGDTGTQLSNFTTYSLRVVTNGLKSLTYPISIDPTIQVKDASDFSKIQTDGSATIDTTNSLIKRASLTGGALSGWTQAANNPNALPVAGYGPDIQFYNDKMYFIRNGSNVAYAPVNSNGDIGAFVDTGVAAPGSEQFASTAIYNGYLYAGSGTQYFYAKIKNDGSIGAFTATNVFSTPNGAARGAYAISVYNGYIYMSGGKYCTASCTDLTSTYTTDVQYAQINPDGSLGVWASAGSAFTTARALHKSVIYNGYFYILGGWQGSLGSAPTNVQYAKINTNGTLGTWLSGTSMTSTRTAAAILALDGFLYTIGGSDITATVQYIPLYANGSMGAWQSTDAITNGRGGIAGATYKDTIYVGGGSSNNGGTLYADVQYATIKTAGHTNDWRTLTNQFTTARSHAASVAYNGYLYVAGGSTVPDSAADALADVQYAAINDDGTLGTWAATTSFSTKRIYHDLVAYNGYLYIVGGQTNNGILDSYLNDVQYAAVSSSGTVGSWTTTQNFTNARGEFATVVYNGYMYVMGGRNGNDNTALFSDVQKATIGTSGALTVDFATTGVAQLPGPRLRTSVTVAAGRLYLVAGCISIDSSTAGCNNNDRDILYTDLINTSTGGFTSWTTDTTKLGGPSNPTDSYDYGEALVINGNLYVVGGLGGYAGTSFAPINAQSGGTGNWTQSTPVSMRSDWTTTTYKGFIYAVAGGSTRSISYTQVNNGGPGFVSAWSAASNLGTARRDFVAGTYAGKIYVTSGCTDAGCTGSIATTSTEVATVQTDGSLSSWTSGVSIPSKRYGATGTIINGYMYVVGGADSTGTNTSTVYYAKINSDGSFSTNTCNTSVTWCTTTNFPATCTYADSVQFQGILYVAGGFCNGGNKVYYAIFASDGSIASWNSGTNLPYTSVWHGEVQAAAGHLYYMGGCEEASCSTYHDDVYYADINTNGSIGSWIKTTKFIGPRSKSASAVANGYIYVFSGENNSSGQYAPILSDGSLGQWQGTSMYTPALSSEIVTYGGRLYEMGGKISNPVNTVTYTTLNSIARIGQFTKLYDFDAGVKPTKLVTRGSKQKGSATNLSYTSTNNELLVLGNAQSLADISYGGSSLLTINLGTNRTLSRYLYMTYTLDDTVSGAFPDSGRESYVSDFDMYYIANPGDRLRGGRSFTDGLDRGLDAQPQ